MIGTAARHSNPYTLRPSWAAVHKRIELHRWTRSRGVPVVCIQVAKLKAAGSRVSNNGHCQRQMPESIDGPPFPRSGTPRRWQCMPTATWLQGEQARKVGDR